MNKTVYTEIKEFMRFINNYEGELVIRLNKAYKGEELVAIFTKRTL